jgi:hypothetical protein
MVIHNLRMISDLLLLLTIAWIHNHLPSFLMCQCSGDQATANLRWLTSQQALADFAYFQTVYQGSSRSRQPINVMPPHYFANKIGELNSNYSKTSNNKWFTIGGSYPGALSSWYRQKYPHLTVGSLASSGVVNAYVLMPR